MNNFALGAEKNEDKKDEGEDEVDPLDAFMLELNKDKIIEADNVRISLELTDM